MKKKILFRLFSFVTAVSLFLYLVGELESYPRFSAYTGENCNLCHVSPTGGSMRNLYGTKYAQDNLQMEAFKKLVKDAKFSPRINDFINIGGDVRIAHIDNQVPNQGNQNTFLTMQGDLYVNAEVNKLLSVFVSSGIEIPNFPTKYEAYGMISGLPAGFYFRAGRFSPDYGIKIVEHRAYQRQDLLNTPYSPDAGLEMGIQPGIFTLNAGLFNGLNTNFFDTDQNKMFVTKGDATINFADYRYNFNFGMSFYNNPYQAFVSGNTLNANRKAWNWFTKIGLDNRVALLGEVDFEENTIDNFLKRKAFTYGELDIRVIQGLELRGQYEYFDPDRDTDNDEMNRYSFGVAAFPVPGMETELMIRIVSEEADLDNDEYQFNFHFYF
ncbi:MAG: hypothetical protein KDC42_04235 [Ignavibacteriae bacterium]|nr:hypothetical protein [Ignavibacteriota bacterium]